MSNTNEIIESLSPIERKIIPYLTEKIAQISEKSGLDKTSILRGLEFLSNKKIITLNLEKKQVVDLDTNGVLYLKNGLPERRLLHVISQKILTLEEAKKTAKLNDNEFKAALGALKKKALIELKQGKIFLNANKEEISKKTLEEQFLEKLPIKLNELRDEQKFALNSLKNRKDIVQVIEKQIINYDVTDFGKQVIKILESTPIKKQELIEQLTPQMIKSGTWKGKKFRRYDIVSEVPKVYGGKRHFVNQSIEYGRKIWTEMGFKEMKGNLLQSSFWNFDALFTAQDHPVRELQDTFYIKNQEVELENKKVVEQVKKSHEKGVDGSKGWQYEWDEKDAKKLVLRTHTTCLSAQTLANLKKEDLPAKFFALGKNFRNETVDWSHGFEFYQTEGIVVGENLTLKHLLGYLKAFYKKMGFEKIRFAPAYFPYTEPSVEISVWHPEKKVWLELGGSGIFRPEVTVPLLGKDATVLAWGQGFDRIITDYYKIKDLREMYKNNLETLRKTKFWIK